MNHKSFDGIYSPAPQVSKWEIWMVAIVEGVVFTLGIFGILGACIVLAALRS